ncbi:MAG: hypothetical protein HQ582_21445 [Planctomycetes bacterium]|nr:hypothetical protein [Planctomycetota bacterium]
MDKKKVTRRAAIGATVGGLAATPFIIRALRGRYADPISRTSGNGTVEVTNKYKGRDITLDVPLKQPSSPEERHEMQTQLVAQLKKNPAYIAAETQAREKFRDKQRQKTIDYFAKLEKQELADLAKRPYTEEQKAPVVRTITKTLRAQRDESLAHIDKLAQDYIDGLSKD